MPIAAKTRGAWRALGVISGILACGVALGIYLFYRNRSGDLAPWPGASPGSNSTITQAGSNAAPGANTNGTVNLLNVEPKPSVATNDAVALVEAGTELFYNGDARGALGKYAEALKLSPDDEEIHFNLARAYSVLGRTNEAIHYYNEALRLLPEYVEAHINLGNLLVSMHRHQEAIDHYAAALKVNPEHSSAINNLGRCLAEMGQTKEAILQFTEAIRLHPEYLEAHFNLAAAQFSLGNFDEAIRQYEIVLRLKPDFSPAREAIQRVRAKMDARKP